MPPTGYKGFTMPVWVMAVTAVLKSAAIAVSFIAVKLYSERQGRQPGPVAWFLDAGIVLLLVTQACIYWKLQHALYSRAWARLHVYMTVFVMLVIPLLIFVITISSAYRLNTPSYLRLFSFINRLRLYLFWSILVTANIFFVANCIKSWRRPDESLRGDIESIGTND